MRRSTFLPAVVLLLALIAAPRADAYTLMGGRTLGVFDYGLQVTAGYPGIDARFHMPILEELEIIPTLSFFYSGTRFGGGLTPNVIGNAVGVDARWRLFKHRAFTLALAWEFQAYWSYEGVGGLRLALPGGVKGDFILSKELALVMSFNAPIGLVFAPAEVFTLPLEFGVGIEVMLTDQVNLVALLQGGPVILLPGEGRSSVTGSLHGSIGIQYLL